MGLKQKAGCLFVCIILLKIAMLVGGVWIIIKVGTAINEHGLKNVIHRVWEGEKHENSEQAPEAREGDVD